MAFEATPAPARPAAATAAPKPCARHGACSPPPAARCSSWPSSPRSPSALRAAAWRPRTPRSSTSPQLTHPARRRGRRAPLPARPLGLRLVPPRSPAPATRTATSAPPSSRSIRCSCAGSGSSAAARTARCCWPRTPISLAAFLGALALLYRLVALELGRPLAAPTLLLLAVFPGALFFGAPYSESLFLLAVGGRLLRRPQRQLGLGRRRRGGRRRHPQRRDRAAAAAGAPWLMVWCRRELGRPAAAPGWTRPGSLLVPLGTAAYAALSRAGRGRCARASSTCRTPGRGTSRGRSWAPGTASQPRWTACGSSLSGQRAHVYFEQAGGDPYRVAAHQHPAVRLPGVRAVAAVGVLAAAAARPTAPTWWRRWPCRSPSRSEPQPLMSLPRFIAVLFPIFMWLALVCEERRTHRPRAGGVGDRARPVHRPVRHLALHRVSRRAVLLDALGTLVELQPPAPRLRAALREAGFEVDEERAAAGFGAEIAYYLEHHLEGADAGVARRPARPLRGGTARGPRPPRARPRDRPPGDARLARVPALPGRARLRWSELRAGGLHARVR